MFTSDYLALGVFHLKTSQEWLTPGQNLSFLFPKEGLGTFASAAINHPLASGDVLVLSEAQGGKVWAIEGGELLFWHFSACLEYFYPLFATEEVSLLQSLTERFKTPRLYPGSSPLAQECHRLLAAAPPGRHLDHRGQLLRVVTAILALEFKDIRRLRGGQSGAGEDMIQVLEGLMVDDIIGLAVEELAGKFHCSSRQLNRFFHEHFGFSVAALRMEMRLIKAMTLLRNRDAKACQVARECGFHHLGLFNSCFKRRFGATPGRWRDANSTTQAHPAGPINGEPLCRMQATGLCPWAGKAPVAAPSSPTATPLSPSRLRKTRSSSGPLAPQRRDSPVGATGDAKLETAAGKELNALLGKRLGALVHAKVVTPLPSASQKSSRL